ncbi:class I SAM-dependent methyltransferase [Planctomicrobium sp. SH664]|uniref:class I SAM-dependent methyltransferase n=1 Tax=Planctomicrobium sp. SH664 TaxID=3448125 RepID=UPI003F5BAE8A
MRQCLRILFFLCAWTRLASAEDPADKVKVPSRYEFHRNHDPNGIGKFYMGREIARVMGHQAIDWLERPEREAEEGLTLLVESLKLQPGMAVADIGAGSGVISLMMAKVVGPGGQVYAVDIQPEMLRAIEIKCKQLSIENVQPVKGTVKTPNLDEGSIDLAIMVDVYHEFNFPFEMLSAIAASLKPSGRVIFVEYRKENPAIPIKEIHKMSEAQVKLEASLPELGLEWVETLETLPRQHIISFRKRVPADPPLPAITP